MKYRAYPIFSVLFVCFACFALRADAQDKKPAPKGPTLKHAVICEGLRDGIPKNSAIVFSIDIGKIFCYTDFEPVPEKTVIYHEWIHINMPDTRIKLALNPPRWSTFSNIQLRESDKGPWRVEISDAEGNIFGIQRFSITD